LRVLSGIQPSGRLHIGNFFGAMRQHLQLQAEHECFYFIADYHALTSNPSPADIAKYTLDVVMDYIALGLDTKKTVFWRQCDVPEVTELTWIFSCITPMGLLQRCVSFKEKVAQGLSPNHGLFAYPVLQAADILIYKSDLVPARNSTLRLPATLPFASIMPTVKSFPFPRIISSSPWPLCPASMGRK